MAKIKEKIRQRVSQILDVLIPTNRWTEYVDLLDRDGKFTRRSMLSITMALCQQVETLENLTEDLYYQLEMLQGSNPQRVNPTADDSFKLRSSHDVSMELEKEFTKDTKAFYVTKSDWSILEKKVDPELSKLKPEYGYGKEVDPKDGNEKICLWYRDLPVFKDLK